VILVVAAVDVIDLIAVSIALTANASNRFSSEASALANAA
jgi:hypothetical protein